MNETLTKFYPGKIVEINTKEELEEFLTTKPHTHVYDSDEGVIAAGFQKNPKILGLCCSCGDIRLI